MSRKSNDVSVYEDLATLKESSKNHGEKLDRLIKSIEGNGKPGLLQDLERYRNDVTEKFSEHDKKFIEIRTTSKATRNTIIIIGVIISAIVSASYFF